MRTATVGSAGSLPCAELSAACRQWEARVCTVRRGVSVHPFEECFVAWHFAKAGVRDGKQFLRGTNTRRRDRLLRVAARVHELRQWILCQVWKPMLSVERRNTEPYLSFEEGGTGE